MSREENWVLSSEDSSCPDETGLELGLGLSIGNGPVSKAHQGSRAARIFTAEDVSSSSSPTVAAGTNRTADSPANGAGQVVGWPPVGAYRMNSFTNQPKPQPTDKTKNNAKEKTINNGDENNVGSKDKDLPRIRSSFVKVNMDGSAIGRKVDPSAHASYETLAQTLEDMFLPRPSSTTVSSDSSSIQERSSGRSKLLDGSSGYALTYEDRDGDWMLVGDVPWRMFLDSVKRLRIMRRTCEANAGLRSKHCQ